MRSIVEVGASVPAFLCKLWKLVNDCDTDRLISWSQGGKTFIIKNQAEFAKDLLPLYYKHNNMASFIRQLNMYGFHKITSVDNGGLRYEKDEIEFSHPCFMRGYPYLLEHIKRKIANPKAIITDNEHGEKLIIKPEIMNKVLADVKQMKGKQESMDAKFGVMKQENEALWREVAILRQKHIKQQQIVNNLIQFLMSLVQPSRSGNMSAHGVKRRYQLMINDAAHNSESPLAAKNPKMEQDVLDDMNEEPLEDGPTIHELVHDDILSNEPSPAALDPTGFITVDIPPVSPGLQTTPSAGTPVQYHVTMEDGNEVETGTSHTPYSIAISNATTPTPIVVSPAPDGTVTFPCLIPSAVKFTGNKNKAQIPITTARSQVLSPSQYTISPAPDTRLPADIFASDDSVSDAGIIMSEVQQPTVSVPKSQKPSVTSNNESSPVSMDKLLNTNEDLNLYANLFAEPTNINIKSNAGTRKKIDKNKSKQQPPMQCNVDLANVKTELQDADWNNMTLATVNNNEDVSRLQSVKRRDHFGTNDDRTANVGPIKDKNECEDHLDTMQSDLDSLRELLRSDSYSLDANMLLGLFGQEDPFYGLNFNLPDDRTKGNTNVRVMKLGSYQEGGEETQADGNDDSDETNQLMSYSGNLPDFEDFNLPEDADGTTQDESLPDSLLNDASALNTPQAVLQSPLYPGKKFL